MKGILPVLFLVIFFGCKNVADKNINQETAYQREAEAELYLIDSILFKVPCSKESVRPIQYRGEIHYMVKDIDAAEKKIKETIAVYSSDLERRNENFTNGVLHKSYEYTIPTADFLAAEEKLDSLLGRAENKYIDKTAVNYNFWIESLTEEQKSYIRYIAKYNSKNVRMSLDEQNNLLNIIKSSAGNIRNIQGSINTCCTNRSTLRIQISAKL